MRVITLMLVLVAASASGCGSKETATPVYDPTTGKLLRIDYDYDGDGRIDVRTFMKNGKTERLEGDADGDGRIDRWEYYRADGTLERIGGSTRHDGREDTWAYPNGDDVRVEISTHRDGVIDRHEYFRKNLLLKTEADTNGDGLMDTWEEYENGRLAVWLVDDLKASGKPTRRLTYAHRTVPLIELDTDGDGRFVPIDSVPDAMNADTVKEVANVPR